MTHDLQACWRLIARRPPVAPRLREKRGAVSAMCCSFPQSKTAPGKSICPAGRNTCLVAVLGFLRFGRTRLTRRTSIGRRLSTSLIRAPVAQRTRSKRRSRSFSAAPITARTSSRVSPSGGCQTLLTPDLTECLRRHAGGTGSQSAERSGRQVDPASRDATRRCPRAARQLRIHRRLHRRQLSGANVAVLPESPRRAVSSGPNAQLA